MAKVTPGNKLYFYQLFSSEIGFGNQVRLERAGEVLRDADVALEDVECESVEELLSELADFVKLTVFKGGRRFATILASEECESAIQRATELAAEQKAAASAGKAWKHGRANKVPKPQKPRHKRAPKHARVEQDVASPTAPAGQAEAAAGGPDATPRREAAHLATLPEEALVPQEEAMVPQEETLEPQEEALVPQEETLAPQEETMEPQEEALTPQAEAMAPQEEALTQQEEALAPQEEALVPQEDAGKASDAATPAGAGDQAAPETSSGISLTITYDPTAAEPPEEEAVPEPAAPADVATEPEAHEPEAQDPSHARPSGERRYPAHAIDWPDTISGEVFCPSELLLELYQALPGTIGILDALDEGWEFAREACTHDGSRTRVTFPLSRRIEGNQPIEVTISRTPRTNAGKRWRLSHVDAGWEAEEPAEEPAAELANENVASS